MAVGFELKATGSHNFKWESGAWTEGSLRFLRVALGFANRGVLTTSRKELIRLIENAFAGPKYQLVRQVGHLGLKLQLAVSGDAHILHHFDPAKPGEMEYFELSRKLAGEKLGDQVVIHLCKCILGFRMHCLGRNLQPGHPGLWMFVQLDL